MAAREGNHELVEYLLSLNEQAVLPNTYCMNVLDMAMKNDREEVAMVIADHDRWVLVWPLLHYCAGAGEAMGETVGESMGKVVVSSLGEFVGDAVGVESARASVSRLPSSSIPDFRM